MKKSNDKKNIKKTKPVSVVNRKAARFRNRKLHTINLFLQSRGSGNK